MAKTSRSKEAQGRVTDQPGRKKRIRIEQSDVPRASLDDALTIATTVVEYGGSAKPVRVAHAHKTTPRSDRFIAKCGAAIAYGLTKGGASAELIELSELGKRAVKPTIEGDDRAAKREAFLKPRVPREFLFQYEGTSLPSDEIALNVLEDMGVPSGRGPRTLDLIRDGARSVGFFLESGSATLVDLSGATADATGEFAEPDHQEIEADVTSSVTESPVEEGSPAADRGRDEAKLEARKKKVFLAHGKNTSILSEVKELLVFGEMEPVVATEKHTVSQPVPDKFMGDMRNCGASIIHVDAEKTLKDEEDEEHKVLNQNVLIEIGASMALYGRRFILLVEEGTKLPSNLQGLFEVRIKGGQVGTSTLPLLKAISSLKKTPLPEEQR